MLRTTASALMAICALLFVAQSHANSQTNYQIKVQAESFQLSQLATLIAADNVKRNWLTPIANPKDETQFFIASSKGQLFILDDNIIQSSAFLNIAEKLNIDEKSFKLTAITLHPNFILNKENGSNTIYTSHIEPRNTSTTKKLTDGDASYSFNFDAVITEWFIDTENSENSVSRELLRIAVSSMISGIQQLSFNPNVTKWQDDFGLLYATMASQEKHQSTALYSGVVLRINPEKSGLHDYTTPSDNPFTQDISINNELLLLGAQKISHINWYKGNSKQLVITHQFNQQVNISLAANIFDWRNSSPEEVILKGEEDSVYASILYQGTHFPSLKNSLLFLQKNTKEWELRSPHPKDLKQSALSTTPSKLEWAISAYQIPVTNHVSIFSDHNNELLLLDHTDNVLFKVANAALASKATTTKQVLGLAEKTADKEAAKQVNSEDTFSFLDTPNLKRHLLTAIGLLISFVFIYFLRYKLSNLIRSLFGKKYVRFELNELGQQLLLFKRGQVSAGKALDLHNVQRIKIALNKNEICEVGTEEDKRFGNKTELDVRTLFKDEYQNKMFENTSRKITLTIIDQHNHHYTVCPYFRKGNQRLTSGKYFDIAERLIDSCWLLTSILHPENTEERNAIKTNKAKNLFEAHGQSRPNQQPKMTAHNPVKNTQDIKENKDATSSQSKEDTDNNSKGHIELAHEEVVDALEKLVNMRQQGLLTEEEFTLAKEKLLM